MMRGRACPGVVPRTRLKVSPTGKVPARRFCKHLGTHCMQACRLPDAVDGAPTKDHSATNDVASVCHDPLLVLQDPNSPSFALPAIEYERTSGAFTNALARLERLRLEAVNAELAGAVVLVDRSLFTSPQLPRPTSRASSSFPSSPIF